MEPFDPRRVNWYRARVVWIARGLALASLAVGAYLVAKRVLFAAFSGWSMVTTTWSDDIGESNSLFRGAAMLLVGSAVLLLSRRLGRLVVPVPDAGCPRCGYDDPPPPIAGEAVASAPRCPECGLRWSS